MTDNRKPSSIRGHAADDCPGIDECGQASSMHEQLSELTAAQARQESQLRLLHTGHQHLAQQLAEVAVTLHKRERESEQLSDRMGLIETAVHENTAVTKDIRDAVVAGRVLKRVAIWGGGTALVLAQWWDQIRTALHLGGK